MPIKANTNTKIHVASECFRTHNALEVNALYETTAVCGRKYDGFLHPMPDSCDGCAGPVGDQPGIEDLHEEEAHFVLYIPVLRCSTCEASYHHTAECTNFLEWTSLTRDGVDYLVCPRCVEQAAGIIEAELDETDAFDLADYASAPTLNDPNVAGKPFYTKAMLHQHLYLRERVLPASPTKKPQASPRSPTSASAKRSHDEVVLLSFDDELEPSSPKRQKREESASEEDAIMEELVEEEDNVWNYPPQPFPSPIY